MNRFGSTIGEVLKWDGVAFDEARVDYLRRVVFQRYVDLLEDPECDDIKIFIKQEPHKLAKLVDERYRLISAVSMVDAMVDRILFGEFFRLVKSQPGVAGVMIGWSPIKNGTYFLTSKLSGGSYLSLDKSAWDWSVQEWLIEIMRELIIDLHVDAPLWFRIMVRSRFKLLFGNPWFQFSDGLRVQQKIPGIMKSGCYLTILLNSLGQLIVHNLAVKRLGRTPPPLFCLGDDTIQEDVEWVDELVREVESLGFKLKIETSDKVKFCGFEMHGLDYLPEYREKHRFLLEHLTLDPEIASSTLLSYQILYYNDGEVLRILRDLIRKRKAMNAYRSDETLLSIVFDS